MGRVRSMRGMRMVIGHQLAFFAIALQHKVECITALGTNRNSFRSSRHVGRRNRGLRGRIMRRSLHSRRILSGEPGSDCGESFEKSLHFDRPPGVGMDFPLPQRVRRLERIT